MHQCPVQSRHSVTKLDDCFVSVQCLAQYEGQSLGGRGRIPVLEDLEYKEGSKVKIQELQQ